MALASALPFMGSGALEVKKIHQAAKVVSPPSDVPCPNRSLRVTQFGIDCIEFVHFTRWEPGGEYVKNLVIKNVTTKTQKIQYKLPSTKFFSMEFPKVMTLSAGMSWTVPITFRPVTKEAYLDYVEFTSSLGRFAVKVEASLPRYSVGMKPSAPVEFGPCPIKEATRKSLKLKNTGEVPCFFRWEMMEPFSVTPAEGELEVAEEITITVHFKPIEACVYAGAAICHFGKPESMETFGTLQLSLEGIGKFSHLSMEILSRHYDGLPGKHVWTPEEGRDRPLSSSVPAGLAPISSLSEKNLLTGGGTVQSIVPSEFMLDFGDVFVGTFAVITFRLLNLSSVPSNFFIRPAEKEPMQFFTISNVSGKIPQAHFQDIQVTYKPTAAGLQSHDYFEINTVSGNTILFSCRGAAVGPNVRLTSDYIDFGDVEEGNAAVRSITLENASPVTAYYQFMIELNASFKFDHPCGSISPRSSVTLNIRFVPKEPMNYFRRVACVVENMGALYLDLIGTCFNSKRRPASINMDHIRHYRQRLRNGLSVYPPEQLEEMINSGVLHIKNGSLEYRDPIAAEEAKLTHHLPMLEPVDEFFHDNRIYANEFTLSENYIDFGASSCFSVVEPQVIRMHNNTKGKVTVTWFLPFDGDPAPFSITPAAVDILPNSSHDFRVHFMPDRESQFYGCEVEAYIYYKSMRSFRLVHEDTFTPPVCLTARFAGHTFNQGGETFIPKLEVDSECIDFPACHVDRQSYRTIKISNTGDTPARFSMLSDPSGVFECRPRHGLLRPNQSQIILARFSPTEKRYFERIISCFFNGSLTNAMEFLMRGVGSQPDLRIEDSSVLFFQPTCVGVLVEKSFYLRNTCRIPISFEWRIPKQYQEMVSIRSEYTTIEPNGRQRIRCLFRPLQEKRHVIKIPCYYALSMEDPLSEFHEKKIILTLLGDGVKGSLVAVPQQLDFGPILVEQWSERNLIISNSGDCDLSCRFVARVSIRSPSRPQSVDTSTVFGVAAKEVIRAIERDGMTDTSDLEPLITVVPGRAHIPARSQTHVKVKVFMKKQVSFQEFDLFYHLEGVASLLDRNQSSLGLSIVNEASQSDPLCKIVAQGVHPKFMVADIRSQGLSKLQLWKHFSLDLLNAYLSGDAPSLVKFFVGDGNGKRPKASLLPVEYDFGAKSIGSPETSVEILVMNTGLVPLEWMMLMPSDLEIEVERWVDTDDIIPTDQQSQKTIVENKLFTMTPRSGKLGPGQSEHAVLTYHHKIPGLHRLPLVYRLKRGLKTGKSLVCTLQGYTIPEGKNYIHFPRTLHIFQPVPIGDQDPPVQIFEFTNTGTQAIQYSLDLSNLEKMVKTEHNFPVFECRQSSGSLNPGEVAMIEWLFRPLEEKVYKVNVPIVIHNGDTTVITFQGLGVSKQSKLPQFSANVPALQMLKTPNELARLSLHRILVGDIPVLSMIREVVTVTNLSDSNSISFEWKPNHPSISQVVKVTPTKGHLKPGESRICKVVFSPANEPRIYEMDIECEIHDEQEQRKYQAAVAAIEFDRKKREMMKSDLSFMRKSKLAGKVQGRRSPLPPLNSTKSSSGSSESSISESEAGSVQDEGVLPAQPKPFRLFLTILARSWNNDDFRVKFKNHSNQFFPYQPRAEETGKMKPVPADLIQDTMLYLLDDILGDPEVTSIFEGDGAQNEEDESTLFSDFAQKPTVFIDPNGGDGPSEVELNDRVLGLPDFQDAVETVMENTIYNLLQEVQAGEWDFTTVPPVVALDSIELEN